MPRIAAFVFISTLSFVVPASAADKGNSQWRPMWNVAHASASRLQVPLAIWVDEPSIIAKQSGVTRGMVERIVELFLRRNGIPSEPETDEPYWFPHIHVAVRALKIEYDSQSGCESAITFLITYRVPWKGTVPQRVRIPPGKLSLQPVAIGADDGGNDIVRSTSV